MIFSDYVELYGLDDWEVLIKVFVFFMLFFILEFVVCLFLI